MTGGQFDEVRRALIGVVNSIGRKRHLSESQRVDLLEVGMAKAGEMLASWRPYKTAKVGSYVSGPAYRAMRAHLRAEASPTTASDNTLLKQARQRVEKIKAGEDPGSVDTFVEVEVAADVAAPDADEGIPEAAARLAQLAREHVGVQMLIEVVGEDGSRDEVARRHGLPTKEAKRLRDEAMDLLRRDEALRDLYEERFGAADLDLDYGHEPEAPAPPVEEITPPATVESQREAVSVITPLTAEAAVPTAATVEQVVQKAAFRAHRRPSRPCWLTFPPRGAHAQPRQEAPVQGSCRREGPLRSQQPRGRHLDPGASRPLPCGLPQLGERGGSSQGGRLTSPPAGRPARSSCRALVASRRGPAPPRAGMGPLLEMAAPASQGGIRPPLKAVSRHRSPALSTRPPRPCPRSGLAGRRTCPPRGGPPFPRAASPPARAAPPPAPC